MKISCIVPIHNAARYLDETLDSIMAQDRRPDEIIAVDDGSTDGSAAVLARRADRITIVQQAHAGVAAARNTGLRHASGDAIAFQDADDLWPSGRLGALAAVLEENAAIDVVAGLVAILDQRETKPQIRENLRTLHRLFAMGSQLVRRCVFDRVGLFNEALEVAEDTEFVMRARQLGIAVARIDVVTLVYRLHAGNISGDVARNQANALDVFRTLSLMRRA